MLPLLVTAAIICHDGNLLITRRKPDVPYPLFWEFPGGKLEINEDPRDCVIREIREELGITIAVESVHDVIYYRYPEKPVLILAYRCRWTSGTVSDIDVAEHRWVRPDELALFNFLPADMPLIEQLQTDGAG